MRISAKNRTIIETLGEMYVPAICPPDIIRGEAGDCYDTCLVNITFTTRYTYVEGMANDVKTGEWMLHAWLTDGIHAFDPTWQAFEFGEEVPMPAEYIGIPMPGAGVAAFVRKTGYKAVLGNAHRWQPFVDKLLATRAAEIMQLTGASK